MMSKADLSSVLLLMNQALASQHGLELVVSDSELFQRRFHAARNAERAKGVTAYDALRVRIISPTTVYLIHEAKDV